MLLAEVLAKQLGRHKPKGIRVGSVVTLVSSTEQPVVNTAWRVAEIKQQRIKIGMVLPKIEVYVLKNRRGVEMEAVPYPVPHGNQFVKWSERKERRAARQEQRQQVRLSDCMSEMEQLQEQLERLANRKTVKVIKTLEELTL